MPKHNTRRFRKQLLDEAFARCEDLKDRDGGIRLFDLAGKVNSCRYKGHCVSCGTVYRWIKSDLKDSYYVCKVYDSYVVYQI